MAAVRASLRIYHDSEWYLAVASLQGPSIHLLCCFRTVLPPSAGPCHQLFKVILSHAKEWSTTFRIRSLLPWQLNQSFVLVSRLSRSATNFKFLLSLICLRFSPIHFLYCVTRAYSVSSYSSIFFFLLPSFSILYFCISFNRDADGRIIRRASFSSCQRAFRQYWAPLPPPATKSGRPVKRKLRSAAPIYRKVEVAGNKLVT